MRLHHLAFRTRNLEMLERFYVDLLGLKVTARRGVESIWLDAAGTILMLEAIANQNEPAIDPASRELVCFAIEAEEFPRVLDSLAKAGVATEASTPFTIYVRDPDGRRIGFSSYPKPRL